MVNIGDLLKLTRRDLPRLSNETIDLIMEMQENGWKGYKNNQGHVKMLAPDGVTYAMATSNVNAHIYLRSDFNQYNKRNGKPVVEEKVPEKQKWKCARPNCPKVYITQEQLNYHINVEHEGKLPCPSCEKMFDRAASLGAHRSRTHGYESPQKKRRKELAAEKKKNSVSEDITKVLDAGDKGARAAGAEMIQKVEDHIVASGSAEIPSREQIADDIQRKVQKGDEVHSEAVAAVLGEKFDTEFLSASISKVTALPPQTDIMSEEMLQKPMMDLKPQNKKFIDIPSLVDFVPTHVSISSGKYNDNLKTIDEAVQGPVETEKVSWTIDTAGLGNERIKDLKRFMAAAGLEMEIRVWRKEN